MSLRNWGPETGGLAGGAFITVARSKIRPRRRKRCFTGAVSPFSALSVCHVKGKIQPTCHLLQAELTSLRPPRPRACLRPPSCQDGGLRPGPQAALGLGRPGASAAVGRPTEPEPGPREPHPHGPVARRVDAATARGDGSAGLGAWCPVRRGGDARPLRGARCRQSILSTGRRVGEQVGGDRRPQTPGPSGGLRAVPSARGPVEGWGPAGWSELAEASGSDRAGLGEGAAVARGESFRWRRR